MKKTLLNERYEPPEIEILFAEVERGYGSSGSDSGGGAGATTPGWRVVSDLQEDDLYNF